MMNKYHKRAFYGLVEPKDGALRKIAINKSDKVE